MALSLKDALELLQLQVPGQIPGGDVPQDLPNLRSIPYSHPGIPQPKFDPNADLYQDPNATAPAPPDNRADAPPAGEALSTQPGQIASNALGSPQGGFPPPPAPAPLPTPPAPQGGAPSASVPLVSSHEAVPFSQATVPPPPPPVPAPQNVTPIRPAPPPATQRPPVDFSSKLDTGTSVNAPILSVPPQAVTATGIDAVKSVLTPEEKLQRQYASPMADVEAARKRDLERRANLGFWQSANEAAAARMYGETPSPIAIGGMLAPSTTNFEVDSMKSAADAAKTIIEARKANILLETDTPFANSARLAAIGDPRFERTAQNMANVGGIGIDQAKVFLYGTVLKGQSPYAIEQFLKEADIGQDFSNKAIKGYLDKATALETLERARKWELENMNAQTLLEAKHSKDSVYSDIVRRFTKRVHVFKDLDFSNATAAEMIDFLATNWPGYQKALDIELWAAQTNFAAAQKSLATDNIFIKRVPVAGGRLTPTLYATPEGRTTTAALASGGALDRAEASYYRLRNTLEESYRGNIAFGKLAGTPIGARIDADLNSFRTAAQSIINDAQAHPVTSPEQAQAVAAANSIMSYLTAGSDVKIETLDNAWEMLAKTHQGLNSGFSQHDRVGAKIDEFGRPIANPEGVIPTKPPNFQVFDVAKYGGQVGRLYRSEANGDRHFYWQDKNNNWQHKNLGKAQ